MNDESSLARHVGPHKVGALLAVGIFLVPYIFGWLLLRKGYSTQARIVGLGWMALIFIAAASPGFQAGLSAPSSSGSAAAPANDQDAKSGQSSGAPAKSAPPGWTYLEIPDRMRGTKGRMASLRSLNNLNFKFPYNGGSFGEIIVRYSERAGMDVILNITKGQFVCPSSSRKTVDIKFDDEPVQQFDCDKASDGTTDIIFIRSPIIFVELKFSHHVTIETEFFQEGRRQLEFNTQGLEFDTKGLVLYK